jgi:hypothetical protein
MPLRNDVPHRRHEAGDSDSVHSTPGSPTLVSRDVKRDVDRLLNRHQQTHRHRILEIHIGAKHLCRGRAAATDPFGMLAERAELLQNQNQVRHRVTDPESPGSGPGPGIDERQDRRRVLTAARRLPTMGTSMWSHRRGEWRAWSASGHFAIG